VPTIFRFQGFNIMIFVDDHAPAHVHAIGHNGFFVFELACPSGLISIRESKGIKRSDERALEDFLNDNVVILCERWREIHG
jgi:hypothetical protein